MCQNIESSTTKQVPCFHVIVSLFYFSLLPFIAVSTKLLTASSVDDETIPDLTGLFKILFSAWIFSNKIS